MVDDCAIGMIAEPTFWVSVFSVSWILLLIIYTICCIVKRCRCWRIAAWRQERKEAATEAQDELDEVEFDSWAEKQDASQECTLSVKGDSSVNQI